MTRIGVMIGLAVLLTVSQSAEAQQNAQHDYTASAAEDSQANTPTSKWRYSTDYDRLRGVTNRFASLTSENAERFSVPYDGGSKLDITIRKMGNSPTNVMLIINRGQILCGIQKTAILVRFDYDRLQSFFCEQPDDGDTSVVFIRPDDKFLKRLLTTKAITIELEFFQEGSRQFVFLSDGLKW